MNKTFAVASVMALLRFAVVVQAADGNFASPGLGYAFDAQKGGVLRLSGVPGAAIAEPLNLEDKGFTNLVVASEKRYALAVSRENAAVALLRFYDAGRTETVPLPVDPRPDQMLLSPGGNWASLRYRDQGSYCVLKNLPEAPELDACFRTEQGRELLAVSDQGAIIIAAENGALLAQREGIEALPAYGHVGAAAFRPGRDEVALFSGAQMYWIAGRTLERVAPMPGDSPVSAQFSRDGLHVYAADGNGAGLTIVDVTQFNVLSIPYSGKVSELQRLNGNAVFLLANPEATSVRVLDGRGAAPRILFVPQMSSPLN